MKTTEKIKKFIGKKDQILVIILTLSIILTQLTNIISTYKTVSITQNIFSIITMLLTLLIFIVYALHNAQTREAKIQIEALELRNKVMQEMNDKLRTFRHDYGNIMQAMSGYIAKKDIEGLSKYYKNLSIECKEINSLGALSMELIKEPAIYATLTSKYYKAIDEGIKINIEVGTIVENKANQNMFEYARVLGILLDNAIEAAKECEEKVVNVRYFKDSNMHRLICEIANTYKDKNIDTQKIYKKGYSSKNSTGLGLFMVQNIIMKNWNFGLKTSHDEKFFIQRFLLDESV